MVNTKVAVLRGGPSPEYEVSLKTGQEVLRHLPSYYRPLDVFISRDGSWHRDGVARPPEEILRGVDVVWNALHGEYGEDGTVQKLLEDLGVPYSGSGTLSSAMAMNKVMAKREVWKEGIKVPVYSTVHISHDIPLRARAIFRTIPQPSMVKPLDAGSSLGVSVAASFEDLLTGIYKALHFSETAIIEEYITGREATCGVIDNFRGQNVYTLFPVEIRLKGPRFFDYKAKYSGASEEICPGNFSNEEKRLIQHAAARVHQILNLRHYSRSDFIVHPRRGVYFLEVNTLPGLTSESLFPKSLRAAGSDLPEFLDHVISSVLS